MYRGIIDTFCRNMLFLNNVGQNVLANLPKLWRHLPPTSRDLQILQIQFFKHKYVLSKRAGPTKKRSAHCCDRSHHPIGSRVTRNQHLAFLTCSSFFFLSASSCQSLVRRGRLYRHSRHRAELHFRHREVFAVISERSLSGEKCSKEETR